VVDDGDREVLGGVLGDLGGRVRNGVLDVVLHVLEDEACVELHGLLLLLESRLEVLLHVLVADGVEVFAYDLLVVDVVDRDRVLLVLELLILVRVEGVQDHELAGLRTDATVFERNGLDLEGGVIEQVLDNLLEFVEDPRPEVDHVVVLGLD